MTHGGLGQELKLEQQMIGAVFWIGVLQLGSADFLLSQQWTPLSMAIGYSLGHSSSASKKRHQHIRLKKILDSKKRRGISIAKFLISSSRAK